MDLKAERLAKHARVAELLDRGGLDGVLLSRRCNFSWYTAGARNYVGTADDVGNSSVLVTPGAAVVLTNSIEATRLEAEELPERGLASSTYAWHDPADRSRVLADAVAGRRIAADVPLAGVAAAPLPPEFNRLRWSLLESELHRYRAVCHDTAQAVQAAARIAKPGQTEMALAGMLARELYARGLLPWVLLVGSDERMMQHRHPLPTMKPVERYFMLATCAERGGLIAACSRLAHFGPVPEDLVVRHRAVSTVDAALIGATQPGHTLGRIFAEAQQAYAAVGWPDEWRMHHQGGSTGYLPREVRAGPDDPTPALPDQAFAWNPTIAGTKCEDTILCHPGGGQLLAPISGWPTLWAEWKGAGTERAAILEVPV
jgi:Xaa-Pro aminopeptidase